MANRLKLLVVYPMAVLLLILLLTWGFARPDPLRSLAPYRKTDNTFYHPLTDRRTGSVTYDSDRQFVVTGIGVDEIKRLVDEDLFGRNAPSWQDMYGISGGKKVWIGCNAAGKDSFAITPMPQNGKPTTKYMVEIYHSMSPWEMRWLKVKHFVGKQVR